MNLLLNQKLARREPENTLPKTSTLLKNVLRVSLPAAAETFFVGLIGMADTIMVGNFSDRALAAVSICQQPVMITLAASVGINAGIIAIISRRKGENKSKEANKTLRQALVISAIISIAMTVFAFLFARPLLDLAGAQSDTIDYAMTYFKIVSASLFFNYMRLSICSGQRAIGKTSITLVTNLAANIINIFLNYLLINGNFGFPRLGVAGAAYATSIGNFVAFLIAVFSITRKNRFLSVRLFDDWKLDMGEVKNLFSVSTGAFVEQLFMRIGFFIIAMIVNRLGTEITAINAIISTIMAMSFNITDGFSIGASALVGHSLGEKNRVKAFAYGRLSQILSIFLALNMMIIVILFRTPLAYAFTTNKAIVGEAARLLLYTSIIMLPQSIQWVTNGVLRGAGDTNYTAKGALISIVLVRPAISWLLCYPIGLGIIGSWMGMFIDQTIRCSMNLHRFHSLKWMEINV